MRPSIFSLSLALPLFMTAACSDDQNHDDDQTLRVGVLSPQTGPLAVEGADMEVAINLAQEHVQSLFNRSENGLKIELNFADTTSDANVSLAAMEEFHADGITAFLGGPIASSSLAHVADYIENNDLLMINSGSTASELAIPGDNIFRLAPNETSLARSLGLYAEVEGISAIAPIFRDDIFGQGMADSVRELDLEFADDIAYSTDTVAPEDFDPYIDTLLENVQQLLQVHDPETVLVHVVSFDEVEALFTRMKEREADAADLTSVHWFATGSAYQMPVLLTGDAGTFAESVSLTGHGAGLLPLDPNIQAMEELNTLIGMESDQTAISSYDSFWLLSQVYAVAGSNEAGLLAGTVETLATKMVGLGGSYELDEAGDRKFPVIDVRRVCAIDGALRWEHVAQVGTVGIRPLDHTCPS